MCIATGAWAQTAPSPGTVPSASPAQSGENRPTQPSERERAAQELKQQEKQRILGVMPNFNTSDIQNAAPLSPGQKFHLMLKTAVDPFQFVASGLDAGVSQAVNNFAGYGQGAQGYAKRFGAAYTDQFDALLWGNAILPSLLHEDPRYFRKGTGPFGKRLFYAVSSVVVTRNDNGTRGPNYAGVFGGLIAGGIANAYYPSTDRGLGLTFQRAFTISAEGALGAVFGEFWPDISRHLPHRHRTQTDAGEPVSE